MYCNFLLVSFLFVQITAKSKLLDDFLKKESQSWCRSHPNGNIFNFKSKLSCGSQFENYKSQQQMKGVKLRVGIITNKNDYDFDCFAKYDKANLHVSRSYGSYLFHLLQKELHFDIEFVTAETWGRRDIHGNWTGLVGLLVQNKIDITMCHVSVTRARAFLTGFLMSTLHSSRCLVFQSRNIPLTEDVFVRTFSGTLWLCFITALILLAVSFKFSTLRHSKLRPDHEPWSWVEVLLWTNAAVCQQSYSRHPKGSSCRTMFLIGYLITYLLYTGFAAGVTSLLAVQGTDSKLTLEDVVIMKLNLIVQADSSQLYYLKNSPDPYARTIFGSFWGMLNKHKVQNLGEMLANLDQRGFVGLVSSVTLKNYIRRKLKAQQTSDYMMSEILNSDQQKAFLIRKNFPYKEIFNYWLLRLKETGLQDIGKRRFIHIQELTCCDEPGWSSAGIGNVLSSVIILYGGIFLSVLVLFFELAWHRRTTSTVWEERSKQEVLLQLSKKKRSFFQPTAAKKTNFV